jgi:hypothetical protein
MLFLGAAYLLNDQLEKARDLVQPGCAFNARGEPRPIAGATQERTLLGVGSTALLGAG